MRRAKRAVRCGLTLMELLVVLTILAVLAATAATMTDNVVEQGRHDATRSALEQIRRAVVGRPDASTDGAVNGFVADLGQPPDDLAQLLVKPAGAVAHTVQAFDSDGDSVLDITLASGWKGPYVTLGVGEPTLRDGWGRPYLLALGPPWTVLSLGADGNSDPPEDGFGADLVLAVSPVEYVGKAISFRLYEVDEQNQLRDPQLESGEKLELRLYRVNPAAGGAVTLTGVEISGPAFQHQLADQAIGRLAARALHYADDGTVKKKSVPVYVSITPGAVIHKDMILR